MMDFGLFVAQNLRVGLGCFGRKELTPRPTHNLPHRLCAFLLVASALMAAQRNSMPDGWKSIFLPLQVVFLAVLLIGPLLALLQLLFSKHRLVQRGKLPVEFLLKHQRQHQKSGSCCCLLLLLLPLQLRILVR